MRTAFAGAAIMSAEHISILTSSYLRHTSSSTSDSREMSLHDIKTENVLITENQSEEIGKMIISIKIKLNRIWL